MPLPSTGALHWRRTREGWDAWATRLFPKDVMPPYYRLIKLTKKEGGGYRVELRRHSPREVTEVGGPPSFTEAKNLAQADYELRQGVDTSTPTVRVESST